MDRKAGGELAGLFHQAGAQHAHRRIGGDDGVIVDGHLQAVPLYKIVLDVVDDIVGLERVGFAGMRNIRRFSYFSFVRRFTEFVCVLKNSFCSLNCILTYYNLHC